MGDVYFSFFFQRYWSLSQQLVVDHPSTLGSRVQELVDWLWGKCVEMYLSILNCLFACCKVIDSMAGGQPGVEGAEDRCTPIQVSALWRCSPCTANVVEMSARISLGSHFSDFAHEQSATGDNLSSRTCWCHPAAHTNASLTVNYNLWHTQVELSEVHV